MQAEMLMADPGSIQQTSDESSSKIVNDLAAKSTKLQQPHLRTMEIIFFSLKSRAHKRIVNNDTYARL